MRQSFILAAWAGIRLIKRLKTFEPAVFAPHFRESRGFLRRLQAVGALVLPALVRIRFEGPFLHEAIIYLSRLGGNPADKKA